MKVIKRKAYSFRKVDKECYLLIQCCPSFGHVVAFELIRWNVECVEIKDVYLFYREIENFHSKYRL